jgi:hypothetical protein
LSLVPGTLLGSYEITTQIGAGGMGEVYRAKDTKLNRDVALKILPELFTSDADRLARFRREAQVLASLNHPNIAAIYGFEDSGATHALVMELVEGEDLSARIACGPIASAEALPIARQIADALEAAHEEGIIHRDLKPANIKVRADGTVKVLDFGLAKAMDPAGASSDAAMNSPTLTARATQMGMIIGTAAYMAPEQARGRAVNRRADVWAFGVVLYEMLTGRRAFEGDDISITLASVLKEDVRWDALPADLPAPVRRLLRRCLEKDPKRRMSAIGDARLELDDAMLPAERDTALRSTPAAAGASAWRLERTMWIAIAVAAAAIATTATWLLKPEPFVPSVVTRFNTPLPEGQTFSRTGRHSIAISPDGTKVAYIANQQIYLRGMDQIEALPIRGTSEDPYELVFSPNGQWIAYFVPQGSVGGGGTLKKIAITGGAPVTLCATSAPFGVSWRGDTIAFGQWQQGKLSAIQAVEESGGTVPRSIVSLDAAKERVRQPQLLDDGAHLIMSVLASAATTQDESDIVVQSLTTGERKVLVHGGTDAHLLSTGHLVYVHDAILFAVKIDMKRFEVSGGPMPVVEDVSESNTSGAGQFAIADNGTLVFAPGSSSGSATRTLEWVDRQGHEELIPAQSQSYHYPRLSPDGRQIAVDSSDVENGIWIWDLARASLTRLTFGPALDQYPVWTSDSRRVIYKTSDTDQANVFNIFRSAADGTGKAERLTQSKLDSTPQSLSPDGKLLVYRETNPGTGFDLMVLPLDPAGPARPLVQTKFDELNGEVSPDGRWIAYQSNESGTRMNIVVRPFPAVDTARWQVTTGGGSQPLWSRSGRELFYLVTQPGGIVVLAVVPVPVMPAGSSFTYGKPAILFPMTGYYLSTGRSYDISPDGRRFLMVKSHIDTTTRPSITVVSHWFDELKTRVGK